MMQAWARARRAMAMATAPALARLQNARSVYVDARGINFEQALGRYGRKIRQDKTLNELLKRQHYMKPSEKRVLAKKEREKRNRVKELKLKLRLVAKLRALGL